MPRVQRGQALVLGLFVLFLGTISLFYMFSTGQVSADKQRVTNTADAAAYSAALWRARVLNYDAYSNRAMIANEVAIAQTLTLASELQFNKNLAACFAREEGDGDTTCQSNLANIAQIIPYWVEIFEAVRYALEIGDQVMTRRDGRRDHDAQRGREPRALEHADGDACLGQFRAARQPRR